MTQKSGAYVLRLLASVMACFWVIAAPASAQGYPTKPIHLMVGFTASGIADLTGRLIARQIADNLGQSVVVENRPGAGGAVATERVATSPADGYTLLYISAADTVQPALRVKLPYDVERDLAPVSLVMTAPFVLVAHPSLPARDVRELIALARSKPGKMSSGYAGVGSGTHLAGALFYLMSKLNVVLVPYKGGAESTIATASGEIEISFTSPAAALPLVDGRKLRALAVTTAKRASTMPSIPTINESGVPGYERANWFGIAAPAGTPRDIVARLNGAIIKGVAAPEIRDAFGKQGAEPQSNTPEQFATLIRGEIAQNIKLIKLTGVKPE